MRLDLTIPSPSLPVVVLFDLWIVVGLLWVELGIDLLVVVD